jgi:hypothetical protein
MLPIARPNADWRNRQMTAKAFAATTVALLLSGCATTPREDAAADNRGPAMSLATLTTATQILSSDAYEGRAPTTPGEEKTVSYLAEQFRMAGLQPGNKGSWYQNVPLVENTASPSAMTISGGSTPLTFAYRTDFVANSYQVQPRIDLSNSDLVFVGYGINAPSAAGTIMPAWTCGERRSSSSSTIPIGRIRISKAASAARR